MDSGRKRVASPRLPVFFLIGAVGVLFVLVLMARWLLGLE